ncbi:hypothetical protein WJX84_000842 [Apatococcus fuscideae]|uniref:Uncharacterized protein n=1 Tax=Apatococcus fuscideae TaxID=2026836 RepID=A0AAW1TBM3_9CHLO
MFLHLPVVQDKLAFSSTCKAAHLASLVGRWLTSELGCLADHASSFHALAKMAMAIPAVEGRTMRRSASVQWQAAWASFVHLQDVVWHTKAMHLQPCGHDVDAPDVQFPTWVQYLTLTLDSPFPELLNSASVG